ncbi:MAG: DUF2497 domain-containing protein [Rickettsiales bacterium]
MAEAAKDQDQSMEEILQSIKRIIAEEGDPVPPTAGDVLELTEMLAEDGSVSHTEPMEPAATETMSLDEIMAAPATAAPAPEPMPAPEPAPAPVPAPSVVAPVTEDSLISDVTREASAAALSALKQSSAAPTMPLGSMGFRSGATVEDLVIESLKPMLREWLDLHLTGIVERLVEREVRRLGGQ